MASSKIVLQVRYTSLFWMVVLFILALGLRIWLGITDSFLHEWDERYHALVAKNLLLHPLKPTLYETPLLNYDFRAWASNHIWLSKPVFPLWFIALSLKIWGLTEWGVRFPSILFSLGSIFFTYKIALHLYDKKVALWAAFFHAIHGLSLEVSAGRFSSDHVDTIFLFWMGLGFWGVAKYYCDEPTRTSLTKYAVWIGLSTGLAFMCKWTAAGVLPLVWTSMGILSTQKITRSFLKHLWIITACFLLIAAPWLVFIHIYYPQEANYMLKGIFSPIQETVQGHSGEWYFYLNKAGTVFGELIYLPMVWLLNEIFKKALGSHPIMDMRRLLLSCWIFIPLVLLSLAATKRHTYLLPLAPAFFILTALFMGYIIKKWRHPKLPRAVVYMIWVALVLLPVRYSIERSKIFFKKEEDATWALRLKQLGAKGMSAKTVIFNEPHAIEAMFYTEYTAYGWMPSEQTIAWLKQSGWRVLKCENGHYNEY